MSLDVERLDEPVEVIFYFGLDQKRPVRFRWDGRVIRIATSKGYWHRREGITVCHYWAVTDRDGNYYELELNADSLTWKLRRLVHTD
ncbi:MAG: hypothetical protein K8R90_03675 [Candidatus Cloacimonetes bacterium]|nr:hypothetical protein [Candidatus Cloacimonadota bacterium]